jgi:hypothetical protein
MDVSAKMYHMTSHNLFPDLNIDWNYDQALECKSLNTNETATRATVDLCVPACVFKLLIFPA